MDELTQLERRVAGELERMMSPGRRVDAHAVARDAIGHGARGLAGWLTGSFRFAAGAAVVVVVAGLLFATTQLMGEDELTSPQVGAPTIEGVELETESDGPGLERIAAADGQPVEGIIDVAVAADGGVWVIQDRSQTSRCSFTGSFSPSDDCTGRWVSRLGAPSTAQRGPWGGFAESGDESLYLSGDGLAYVFDGDAWVPVPDGCPGTLATDGACWEWQKHFESFPAAPTELRLVRTDRDGVSAIIASRAFDASATPGLIVVAKGGTVWTVDDRGLLAFDDDGRSSVPFERGFANGDVRDLAVIDDEVWVLIDGPRRARSVRWDGAEWHSNETPPELERWPNAGIERLPNGTVLVGGLTLLVDGDEGRLLDLDLGEVAVGADGSVWAVSQGRLLHVDPSAVESPERAADR